MADATTVPEIRNEAVREFISGLTHVFVMAINHGSEGHTAPLQVFLNEQQARAAVALARAVYAGCADVYRVPVWPQPATDRPQPLDSDS